MNTIEDLYYGRISPYEMSISTAPEYQKLKALTSLAFFTAVGYRSAILGGRRIVTFFIILFPTLYFMKYSLLVGNRFDIRCVFLVVKHEPVFNVGGGHQ